MTYLKTLLRRLFSVKYYYSVGASWKYRGYPSVLSFYQMTSNEPISQLEIEKKIQADVLTNGLAGWRSDDSSTKDISVAIISVSTNSKKVHQKLIQKKGLEL